MDATTVVAQPVNHDLVIQIVVALFGLLILATSGLASIGVGRLLKKTDTLKDTVDAHGQEIAAMKVKMPNGEWRQIKEDVSKLHSSILDVAGEVSSVCGDLSKHIADETLSLAEMRSLLINPPAAPKKQRVRARR